MIRFALKPVLAVLALLCALALVVADADARIGGGSSSGSRGSRTYTAPPATSTAPTTARPIERSMTQPSAAARPGAAAPSASPGGFFSRPGLLGGLAAGFLGAGLLGLLFGGGLAGGLGGLASIFGLVIQVALIAIVGTMLWKWWQRRQQQQQQPAFAGAGPQGGRPLQMDLAPQGGRAEGAGSFLHPAQQPASTGPSDQIGINERDYERFEQLLNETQAAYGREDLNTLRNLLTPEMLSYTAEEFADNASRGESVQLSGTKLLQGDLAEAWREGDTDYATVAMRYNIVDKKVDRASGRVIEGGDEPQEVTEHWTFRRAPGRDWILSAIQQAG
jgi:predicted lipid-binding transport protein (Tim44 family)